MKGFASIGLYQPKSQSNVGSVLRACQCYDVDLLCVQGKRYIRAPTDVFHSSHHLPLLHVEDLKRSIPFGARPVAIEYRESALSLVDYQHPVRAFYIFGPEDGDIPDSVLEWCREIVYVPTAKCMNLAATVNVVLYDRLAKQQK